MDANEVCKNHWPKNGPACSRDQAATHRAFRQWRTAPSDIGTTTPRKIVPRFPANLYRAPRQCCTTVCHKFVPRVRTNLYHGFWTDGTVKHIGNCNSPCILQHVVWPNCTTVSVKLVPPNRAHLYHGFCEKARVHEMTKPSHIDAPTQLTLPAMYVPRPGQMLGQFLAK